MNKKTLVYQCIDEKANWLVDVRGCTGLDRATFDRVLKQLHDEGYIALYKADNPRDLTPARKAAAYDMNGAPRHIAYRVKPRRNPPPRPVRWSMTPPPKTEVKAMPKKKASKSFTKSGDRYVIRGWTLPADPPKDRDPRIGSPMSASYQKWLRWLEKLPPDELALGSEVQGAMIARGHSSVKALNESRRAVAWLKDKKRSQGKTSKAMPKKASKKSTKSSMTQAKAKREIAKLPKASQAEATRVFNEQIASGSTPLQALTKAIQTAAGVMAAAKKKASKKTAKKRGKKTAKKRAGKKRVAKATAPKKAAAKKVTKKTATKKAAKKVAKKAVAKTTTKKRTKKAAATHTTAAKLIKGAKTGTRVSKVTKAASSKAVTTRRTATAGEARLVRVNELINKARRNNYRLWVCAGLKPRGCGGSTKYNRTRTVGHLA